MPPSDPKKQSPVVRFLLTFAIVYLVTMMGMRILFPDRFNGNREPKNLQPIVLSIVKNRVPLGRNVDVKIQNNTEQPFTLPARCPSAPFIVEKTDPEDPAKDVSISTDQPAGPCHSDLSVAAGASAQYSLGPWKYQTFAEPGIYRISIPEDAILLEQGLSGSTLSGSKLTALVSISEPGLFTSLFRAFISKPILNAMVLIASVLPGHSLGWSIILLTILIKFLLFFPTQHALEGQRKLQKIQPKLNELKKQYGKDQKKLTEETMKLWKQEKINPFQSCLPTLLQIPVLLGLFFIIRDSNTLELARHLLYAPLQNLDWSFSHTFLGFLDLSIIPFNGISFSFTSENIQLLLRAIPIPLIIASLQFGQMKLSFAHNAKKKEKEPGKEKEKKQAGVAETQQKMMMYMLPLMLLFFAGTFPIAVSLYWGTSTLFGIAQQVYVNRRVA